MKISEEAQVAAAMIEGYLERPLFLDERHELQERVQTAINTASQPMVDTLESIAQHAIQPHIQKLAEETIATFRAEHGES